MKLFMIIHTFFILTYFTLASCNSQSFSGSNKGQPSSPKVDPGTGKEDTGEPGDGTNVRCPPEKEALLILDLKSGWWSGDGGDYFKVILGGLSDPQCSSQFAVEYHHIVQQDSFEFRLQGHCESLGLDLTKAEAEQVTYQFEGDFCRITKKKPYVDTKIIYPEKTDKMYSEATFGSSLMNDAIRVGSEYRPLFEREFSEYTQIWLLSGSEGDILDFQIDHAFFVEMLNRIADAKHPIFVGAGFGSISHANALTEKLGLGEAFATNIPKVEQGEIVDLNNFEGIGQNSISIESKASITGAAAAHELFIGVTEISDKMLYVEQQRNGEKLSSPRNLVIASDQLKIADLLVGDMIGIAAFDGLPIVMDAGMQRFYSVHSDSGSHQETLAYLQNIVLFLGKGE